MTTPLLTPPEDTVVEATKRIAPGTNDALRLHDRWIRFSDTDLTPLESAASLRKLSVQAQDEYWRSRQKEAKRLHFPAPFDQAVESLLVDVHAEADAKSDGDPSVAFVYGPNGSGKTTAITRVLRRWYTASMPESCSVTKIRPALFNEHTDNQYCPVLPIQMASSERKEAFDSRVLNFLAIDQAVKVRDQALQVEHALTQCGVRILSIDETDKVKGTDKARREIAYRWRALASVLAREGGFMILAGNSHPQWLGDLDQTLVSRVLSVEVPYLNDKTPEERVEFIDFLHGAEEKFQPWFASHDLGLGAIAGALFHESGGQMRTLSSAILHVAVRSAQQRRSATHDMLADFRRPDFAPHAPTYTSRRNKT